MLLNGNVFPRPQRTREVCDPHKRNAHWEDMLCDLI